jgi:hypothetical protein
MQPPSEQNWKDSLIYLVRQGAELHALGHFGRSASYLGCSETCLDDKHSLGTYPGDLFDAVINYCGYNIFEFRKGHSWKRKYGSSYIQRDFELLWEGREHLFPNWSDTEWPITSQNNIEGNY